MRTRLTITVILGLLTLAFVFNPLKETKKEVSKEPTQENMLPPTTNGGLDKFYIGAINDDQDYHYSGGEFQQLHVLGFNLWHEYLTGTHDAGSNRWYPASSFGWAPDNLLAEVSTYYGGINTRVDNIYSHDNRRLIMMRPKLEYLCYGQRSDYRCVDTTHLDDTRLWFYSFQSPNHVGTDVTDSYAGPGNQHYVRYCQSVPNSPVGGMVVNKLKANTEQCRTNPVTDHAEGQWQADNQYDWLIKPRIRIDSTVAHSPLNPVVCNIKVISEDGSTILKNVDIHAQDFLVDGPNHNQFYNGRYIEEYNFAGTDLKITHQAWGTDWMWGARGNRTTESGYNLTDIQVYWYGNCDMWIDYVRVDNDVADELMNPGNSNYSRDNQWLEDEVTLIGINDNVHYPIIKYYMELCEFNNLPCMAYVNHKIDSLSNGHIGLVEDLTPDNISFHVSKSDIPRIWNADFLYHEYVQKVGFTALYSQSYPLNACHTTNQSAASQPFSKVPSTLPNTTGDRILAEPVSSDAYDYWLQNNLNHEPSVWEGGSDNTCGSIGQWIGDFRSSLQMCNALSKLSGLPFIYMPQAHGWYTSNETHREPTNEELDMMTNVAVSYGAKSLNFYWYPSTDNLVTDGPPRGYSYSTGDWGKGIINADNNLITRNYYSEDHDHGFRYKWEVLRDIADRMTNKWNSYLISFDNTQINSYIYNFDNERDALLQNSYFADVATYLRGTVNPACINDKPENVYTGPVDPSLIYECNDDRYLQIATFKASPDDGYPYYMVVNRRCSPLHPSDHNDGERYIRVRFKTTTGLLPTYDNWNIYELPDEKIPVATFSKSANKLVDLRWFNPGEGKLYKIVPVMKSGGTLLADENLNGVTFTCLDTVWNNGYNINISGNSTISFTDSATIVTTGGTFQVGSSSNGPGTQYNTFQGTSGHKWNGLQFNGTNVKLYNAKFQDINGQVAGGNYAVTCIDCPLNDIRYSNFIMGTIQQEASILHIRVPRSPLSILILNTIPFQ